MSDSGPDRGIDVEERGVPVDDGGASDEAASNDAGTRTGAADAGPRTDADDADTQTDAAVESGGSVDVERYVSAGDDVLAARFDEAMSFEAYLERIFENPTAAAHSAKYLVRAIESMGTRTVLERGEERERYRFFDDPRNDEEHAVLGNTETLNEFVKDLKAIASGRGKSESITWFTGPTATGKSELKRCLINGLRAFSKTPEGRRYTVEWNTDTESPRDRNPMTYGGADADVGSEEWRDSPVQAHPLLVLPEEVRADVLDDLSDAEDSLIDTVVEGALPPFSRELFERLADAYRDESGMFSAVTADRHLRVKNYVVEEGRGVGVLHAEDSGSPKERLVGSWMPSVLGRLDARGRKDPQAFSFDGVLSQGNGGLTVIEDASKHADLLQQLLNVPEEREVKLDRGIRMGVDTQIIVISNPDLEAQLDQHADHSDADPLKALKRRLTKYEVRYLLNVSLEAQLLWRKLADASELWTMQDETEIQANVRAPMTLDVSASLDDDAGEATADGDAVQREIAPHAIEAAALYDVVSRLDADDLPGEMDLVEKALLFDRGYVERDDEVVDSDEFDWNDDADDGRNGVPVTYTRDVFADLVSDPADRRHDSLPVEDVVLPQDVLNAMVEGMAEAPVFSEAEAAEFETRLVEVKEYVLAQQADDVQAAILRDEGVSRDAIETYVEHVYAWGTEESGDDAPGETDRPDPLRMKVFETERLGRFTEDDYDGVTPSEAVEAFRRGEIISAVNRILWQERDEDYGIEGVDYRDIPALRVALETNDWNDVQLAYEDLDPAQWADPQSGTETAAVKAQTIENMCELFDYTPASAELVSRRVMAEVSYRWD